MTQWVYLTSLLCHGTRFCNLGHAVCYMSIWAFQHAMCRHCNFREARMSTYQCCFNLQIQKKQQPANSDWLFSVHMALANKQSQRDMRTPLRGTDSDSIIAATTNVQVWDITQLLLTAWTVHHCQEQAGFCQWLVCLARPWKHLKLAPMGTCQAATWFFRQWCKCVVLLPASDHCIGMYNSQGIWAHDK